MGVIDITELGLDGGRTALAGGPVDVDWAGICENGIPAGGLVDEVGVRKLACVEGGGKGLADVLELTLSGEVVDPVEIEDIKGILCVDDACSIAVVAVLLELTIEVVDTLGGGLTSVDTVENVDIAIVLESGFELTQGAQ